MVAQPAEVALVRSKLLSKPSNLGRLLYFFEEAIMKHDSKRLMITTIFTLALVLFGLTAYAQDHNHQGQGQGMCKGCQQGKQAGGKQDPGQMQGRMGGGRMEDMQTIHTLFAEHKKITRTINQLANGVVTVTESDDPKVRALIAEHAWAMQKRLENRQPIRMWDPLFVELFKHADKIEMKIEKTAKGVKVTETSADPWVVKLIQAHAEGVSEFVREGTPSMHKSHELPGAKPAEQTFLGKGDGVTTCPVTGESVDKNISAELFGRTVYFCCASCRDAVKKNPELYLKP